MLRLTSIITLFCFLASGMAYARIPESVPVEPEKSIPSIGVFEIPGEMGKIEDQFWSAGETPLVILIQDAHAVVDAQHQIHKLIEYLTQKYGIRLVALEGGEGELDPTLFRAFPDEKVKERVLDRYLERGELSGADMAAVFNLRPAKYVGIEDGNLYEENYFAYLRAIKGKDALLEKLAKLKEEVDRERKKIYSPKLNEFHERVSTFKEGKSDLLELLKYLRSFTGLGYPVPRLFDLLEKEETEIDPVSVASLAEDFRKNHLRRLNKNQSMQFNRRYQAFTTGEMDAGTFLNFFAAEARELGIPLELSPEMLEKLELMKQFSAVKETKLAEELEGFLEETESKLITTPAQKELSRKYKELTLLKDLASLELTRNQWEKLQLQISIRNPQSAIRNCMSFYRLAVRRDEALQKNLARLLEKEKTNRAVVVAGGFHSEGFKRAFKEKGFSYVVISPRMQSLKGREHYSELMQGGLSYKKYLKAGLYDAFAKDASRRLADEWGTGANLKYWRDELIRTLAREGRITQAGEYTRYIDRLAAPNRERLLAEIFKELDAFKEESLSNLRDPFPKPSALIQLHPLFRDRRYRLTRFISTGELPVVSGSSLGEPGPKQLATSASSQPVTLSTIIPDVIDSDIRVEGLTAETVRGPEIVNKLRACLDREVIIVRKIEDTLTDRGSALSCVLERAEDQFFNGSRGINIGALSVPLVSATHMGEEFNLSGFPDDFKTCIYDGLKNEIKRDPSIALAMVEDPDSPHSAYLGGRIILLGVPALWMNSHLNKVVQKSLLQLKDKYRPQIAPQEWERFQAAVDRLSFFASHVEVYLPHGIPKGDDEELNPDRIKTEFEIVGRFRCSQEELDRKSDRELIQYHALYDHYLAKRRDRFFDAARYWIERDRDHRVFKDAPENLMARSYASTFIELFLEDAFNKLNERLETFEKTANQELRDVIDRVVYFNPSQPRPLTEDELRKLKRSRIPVLDNDKVQEIKRHLELKKKTELLATFYRSLQEGRAKSIPLFNYHTGRLPRLKGLLSKFRKDYGSDLARKWAKLTLSVSTNESSGILDSVLADFKSAYRNYRLVMEEALVLAYRDPRLEGVFKMMWIDEVLEADRQGLLDRWKRHIRDRAKSNKLWMDQHEKILLEKKSLRFPNKESGLPPIEELIQPRVFVFKRPVGDETGFVVKDSEGRYWVGFAEFNKGNAYFHSFPPDGKDTVYHGILLGYLKAAEDYLDREEARTNPLGFFEQLNEVIRGIARQEFPTTEKVETDNGEIQRMPTYVFVRETTPKSFPLYVISREGQVYVRRDLDEDWTPSNITIQGNDPNWIRYKTTLSASFTSISGPMALGPESIRKAFELWEIYVRYQKQDPGSIGRVVEKNLSEIEAVIESKRQEKLHRAAGSAGSLGSGTDVKRFAANLPRVFGEVKAHLETCADLPEFIRSGEVERRVGDRLGDGASLIDVSELGRRLRAALSRIAGEGMPVLHAKLSPEAKYLLRHPGLLNQVYKHRFGSRLLGKTGYVLDAAFLHGEGVDDFVMGLVRSGSRVAVPFSKGTADETIARRLLPHVLAAGYDGTNPLKQRQLQGLSEPVLILPTDISFVFSPDSDWQTRGVVADPALTNAKMIDVESFVPLVEMILKNEFLRTRLVNDKRSPFPVLTQDALSSVIHFLNQLARSRFAQELMDRAA